MLKHKQLVMNDIQLILSNRLQVTKIRKFQNLAVNLQTIGTPRPSAKPAF
jgi:hypothetical protein